MNEPVTVIARMQAKPDQVDELRAALDMLVAETRREVGCQAYDLHVSADDPARFLIHEVWDSPSDLDAHGESDHIAAFGDRATPLLAEPPQVDRLTRIE